MGTFGLCFIPHLLFGQPTLALGPIPIRNQFPISLRFLNFTPDSPLTLPEGTYQLSYQMVIGNTFINTRGESGDLNPSLVQSGLNENDFLVCSSLCNNSTFSQSKRKTLHFATSRCHKMSVDFGQEKKDEEN